MQTTIVLLGHQLIEINHMANQKTTKRINIPVSAYKGSAVHIGWNHHNSPFHCGSARDDTPTRPMPTGTKITCKKCLHKVEFYPQFLAGVEAEDVDKALEVSERVVMRIDWHVGLDGHFHYVRPRNEKGTGSRGLG
jgi:hypothetical protein